MEYWIIFNTFELKKIKVALMVFFWHFAASKDKKESHI
tara:strand:- start:1005 stop:1118 length:114 start_codon:yes stop_codon:yes gene_type:complete